MSLFSSVGLKRRIAAALSIVLYVISGIPGTEAIALAVQEVAGVFGLTGMVHAAKAGTVSRYAIISAVAVINIALAIAPFYPPLLPAVPALQKIAVVLSSATIGATIIDNR